MSNGDDPLDVMLRRRLSDELDGLRGQSADRFRAHLAHQRRRRWLWGAGLAAAAMLTLALLLTPWRDGDPPRQADIEPSPAPAAPQIAEQSVIMVSRLIDDGTVLIDGRTPMRQVRRQWIERAEWIEPQDQASVRMLLPREQVILIGTQQQ